MVWHGQKKAQQLTWPAVKRQRCPLTPILHQNRRWWKLVSNKTAQKRCLEQGYVVTGRNLNLKKKTILRITEQLIRETWLHHGPRCSRIVHCRDDPMFCFETKRNKKKEAWANKSLPIEPLSHLELHVTVVSLWKGPHCNKTQPLMCSFHRPRVPK